MAFLQDQMNIISMVKLSVTGLDTKMGTFVTFTCDMYVFVCFCSLFIL